MASANSSSLRPLGVGAILGALAVGILQRMGADIYTALKEPILSYFLIIPSPIDGLLSFAPYITIVIALIGLALIVIDFRNRRRRRRDEPPISADAEPIASKLTDNLPQTPILQYGKIRVKRNSYKSFGGVLNSRYYYIEIINTAEGLEAINCQGDIKLDGDTYSTTWEKNRDYSINIGHRELLFVFEILDFIKDTKKETRLYLDWGSHSLDDEAMNDYVEKLNKEMTVLIHSENAKYPKKSESFRKTLQQIISEAVAD